MKNYFFVNIVVRWWYQVFCVFLHIQVRGARVNQDVSAYIVCPGNAKNKKINLFHVLHLFWPYQRWVNFFGKNEKCAYFCYFSSGWMLETQNCCLQSSPCWFLSLQVEEFISSNQENSFLSKKKPNEYVPLFQQKLVPRKIRIYTYVNALICQLVDVLL